VKSLLRAIQQSFQTKLLITYAFLWLSLSGITGFVVYRAVYQGLEEKMGQQLIALGRLAAFSLEKQLPSQLQPDTVENTSSSQITDALQSLLNSGVIENLSILNPQGTVLANATGEAVEGFKSPLLTPPLLEQINRGVPLVLPVQMGDFGLLHQTAFIPMSNHLLLEVDADPNYLDILKQFRNLFLFLGLAGLALSAAVGTWVAKTILSPVKKVAQIAGSIAQGQYPEIPPVTREDELGQLVDSLRTMSHRIQDRETQLERMAQAQKEIAGGIAHEVRNPLGVIRGQAEWIAKKTKETPELINAAQKIETQVKNLNHLVTNFLEYSREPQLQKRWVELPALINEIEEGLGELIRQKNARLLKTVNSTESLWVDPALLSNTLLNLGRNALEAMPPGGTLTLGIEAQIESARFWVEDTGPGIPMESLDKIFHPFFSTKPTGTGLGLAFVEKAIRAHEGNIQVRNKPEGGAIFEITLPRRKP